jgi:hypothetical protein
MTRLLVGVVLPAGLLLQIALPVACEDSSLAVAGVVTGEGLRNALRHRGACNVKVALPGSRSFAGLLLLPVDYHTVGDERFNTCIYR